MAGAVKINKDGTVTVDGDVRGRVERTTEGTSIISTLSGQPGPVMWIPRGRDDKALTEPMRRRADAVRVVAECGAPVTASEVQVSTWDSGDRSLWEADLRVRGHYFGVSRRIGQECWTVHYHRAPGAFMPRLSTLPGHGGNMIADPECVRLLNEAARAAGMPLPD